MFVILFAYVFGGAIQGTGAVKYINFLLPGILVQTVLFGAMMTGVGLAADMTQGMIDRFLSLPMSRSAVLMGRTISDLMRNVFVVILITLVGYLIGYRFEGDFGGALLAFLLVLIFGFAFSWVSALIGIAVKNVETAQSAGFIWVFPLAFISSIFVPASTMPKYFRIFADHNPVTYVASAVRALSFNQPLGNNYWYSLIWIGVILAIFIPLAVWKFSKINN